MNIFLQLTVFLKKYIIEGFPLSCSTNSGPNNCDYYYIIQFSLINNEFLKSIENRSEFYSKCLVKFK